MNWLYNITNLFTGGLASTVMGTIEKYLPPDLSPEQKAQMLLALQNLELEKTAQAATIQAHAQTQMTQHIAQLEGTASELKTIPILGPIMVFLRACQRPVWGFATLYMDTLWFSGHWTGLTATQERALLLVNGLVLVFLFGERAVKNALPAIQAFMSKGGGRAQEKP